MTARPWHGHLIIHAGWATWEGLSGSSDWHRHIAAQAVEGASGPVRVEQAGGSWSEQPVTLVEPLVPHRIAANQQVRLTFIEPWSGLASCEPRTPLFDRLADAAHRRRAAPTGFWAAWALEAARRDDPPVARGAWAGRACAWIDEQVAAPPSIGALRLADLARHLGLGADHARHRFVAEVGLPFRRFVLWRRLRAAVLALESGDRITDAAHAAGFADAAHLARTIKAMFGVSCSQLR